MTPEENLETLVINTKLNDELGRLTFYAVICPEHGGLVSPTAPKAIEAAYGANRMALEEGAECAYFAVAIGLDAELVSTLLADPPEGA